LNDTAFVLTIEAILALLLAATIAAFPVQAQKTNLSELLLLQKENDLLKAWLQEKELREEEMLADFEFVFPEFSGSIRFDGKTTEIKKTSQNASERLSSGALFLQRSGNLAELSITVYH